MTKDLYYPLQGKTCQGVVGVEGAEPHGGVGLEVSEHSVWKERK